MARRHVGWGNVRDGGEGDACHNVGSELGSVLDMVADRYAIHSDPDVVVMSCNLFAVKCLLCGTLHSIDK